MNKMIVASLLVLSAFQAHAIETKIAGGNQHTVFINNGNVYGMGTNNEGELLMNSSSIQSRPVYLGYQNVKSVMASVYRTAVLFNDGTVKFSGRRDFFTPAKTKVQFTLPVSNVKDAAMSQKEFYYVVDGVLFKWTYQDKVAPVAVTTAEQGIVESVAASDNHAVVLFKNGTVGTIGLNTFGQLGNGAAANKPNLAVVKLNLSNVSNIAVGQNRTFFLMKNGTVLATGANSRGELGIPDLQHKFTPTLVKDLSNVKKLVSGSIGTTALLNDGTIKVSGWHNYIQPGIYNVSHSFTSIGITGVSDIGEPSDFTIVDQSQSGVIAGWGGNTNSKLGDGTNTERHTLSSTFFTVLPNSIIGNPKGNCSDNTNGKGNQDNGNGICSN